MVGQSIAHYKIIEKIGEGGMGEVYRATDTKLNRDVALKVLPEAFAQDEQRMARFSREAQVLASLNHPNIGAIFGLEEEAGKKALVLELIEGETLAERISKGPIPLESALKIALQIAEALEAAHEKGIIHRDLKPANVKITPDGQVKVLDFGLAKALEEERAQKSIAESPTLSLAATQAGIILGTAAYMSPEQAHGEATDRRADIWAFGVVLFEMLSGQQLFSGKSVSQTLARVLERDPDWDQLPASVSPAVRALLKRCLEKEPRERLQAIGEARIQVMRLLADPEAAGEVAGVPARLGARQKTVLAAGVAALLVLTSVLTWSFKPDPTPRTVHIEGVMGESRGLFTQQGSSVILASDGSRLAYCAGQPFHLSLRSLDQFESQVLSGTENGYNPFFSPDGQWLGFVTRTELKKVAISGGAPLKLCSVTRNRGSTWGPDGTIVFAPNPASGLMRVSAAGGEPQELTALEEGESSHRWPQFLPDGRHVVYAAYTTGDVNEGLIKVADLETGQSLMVHRGGTYPRYVASGHLLYWREGTVFAAPFDLGTLQMTALPAPVLQGVAGNSNGGANFDVAHDGTLVYLEGDVTTGSGEIQRTLVWSDLSGTLTPASQVKGSWAAGASLSPDEKQLAVGRSIEGNLDIWVVDLDRDTPTRLTFHESVDVLPIWSPDGRVIYFASQRSGRFQIFRKAADGSAEAEQVHEGEHDQAASNVSPDGKYVVYQENHPETRSDLWVLPLDGEEKPRPFLITAFAESAARFSPDGRWLAYHSDESGRDEVYVRPFPGPGGKWQVSSGGGEEPRWTADGSRLLFWQGLELQEASIAAEGNALKVGRPERIRTFQGFTDPWDASGDGSRLILIQNPTSSNQEDVGAGEPDLVKFTFHWFEELRQLLATSQ